MELWRWPAPTRGLGAVEVGRPVAKLSVAAVEAMEVAAAAAPRRPLLLLWVVGRGVAKRRGCRVKGDDEEASTVRC